jgi:hypothetical protein
MRQCTWIDVYMSESASIRGEAAGEHYFCLFIPSRMVEGGLNRVPRSICPRRGSKEGPIPQPELLSVTELEPGDAWCFPCASQLLGLR